MHTANQLSGVALDLRRASATSVSRLTPSEISIDAVEGDRDACGHPFNNDHELGTM
jgi:hypothetical protein